MGNSAGGAFLPSDPPPSTGQVITNPTIVGAAITATGSTLTAPVISGAATLASGSTITTPTIIVTTTGLTGTGATGGAGAVMPTVTPAFVYATGASGSGVDLLTGPAGQAFFIANLTTGALNIYCVGGTINGTTGTTAFAITATGNRSAWAVLTSATGAWQIRGNT